MKTLKRIACSFLAIAMVIGLTACSQQKFDHKKIAKFCDDQDFECSEDSGDFIDDYGSILTGIDKGHAAENEGERNKIPKTLIVFVKV